MIKSILFTITFFIMFAGCDIKTNEHKVLFDKEFRLKSGTSSITIFTYDNFAYSFLASNEGTRIYFTSGNVIDANGVNKKNLKIVSLDDGKDGIEAIKLNDGTLRIKKDTKAIVRE